MDACSDVGTAIEAAFGSDCEDNKSFVEGYTGTWYSAARLAARDESGSTIPMRQTGAPAFSSARQTRRWLRPNAPAPITTIRDVGDLSKRVGLLSFDRSQATRVEVQQVTYLILGLRTSTSYEACGWRGWTTDTGGDGDEL